MPIYTYECDNCGVRFDHQQKYNERNLSRCRECGKKTLHRVYRPVGVVFKGSGFYVTDNRSSSTASRPTADTEKKSDTTAAKDEGGTPKKKTENSSKKES